ncbi:uncharacterized protein [Amphiura filiformis]|uniref:uncharacterized protein n=1 Tax=Amphiura filiformis TaxID=82378 RepID=UPI003B22663E
MSRLLLISLALTACIISVTFADQILVDVATRYITTSETTLLQKESKIFRATLCSRFNNHAVNATMLLNNNPSWDKSFGVIGYYIVDSPSKGSNESLCNNTDSMGHKHATCLISNWTSTTDMYLVATNGEVDSIVFSVDIKIRPLASHAKYMAMHSNRPARAPKPKPSTNERDQDMEILTEIVNILHIQSIQYHQSALLTVNFCKNSQTTDNYEITSSVAATDGKSSYAQYLCSGPPCEVDGATVIGFDGKQLPNNNVFLTTESGEYQSFQVLIICWAGEYDPQVKNYVGHFQYSAQIKKT